MAEDIGKLVLRMTLGALMLFHGVAKVLNGTAGIERMLEGAGLPGILAFGVYVGEVLAPLLVMLGFYTRAAAGLIVVNMIVAVLLVHRAEFFLLAKTGGWALELQAFYFFTALAIALIGPGRYGVDRR